jgi:hypothetical protein
MDIYNNIHVLLSTLYYMFRRLWHHLQGELYRMLNYCYIFYFDYIVNGFRPMFSLKVAQ